VLVLARPLQFNALPSSNTQKAAHGKKEKPKQVRGGGRWGSRPLTPPLTIIYATLLLFCKNKYI